MEDRVVWNEKKMLETCERKEGKTSFGVGPICKYLFLFGRISSLLCWQCHHMAKWHHIHWSRKELSLTLIIIIMDPSHKKSDTFWILSIRKLRIMFEYVSQMLTAKWLTFKRILSIFQGMVPCGLGLILELIH